jgi:hypothetical protein
MVQNLYFLNDAWFLRHDREKTVKRDVRRREILFGKIDEWPVSSF